MVIEHLDQLRCLTYNVTFSQKLASFPGMYYVLRGRHSARSFLWHLGLNLLKQRWNSRAAHTGTQEHRLAPGMLLDHPYEAVSGRMSFDIRPLTTLKA